MERKNKEVIGAESRGSSGTEKVFDSTLIFFLKTKALDNYLIFLVIFLKFFRLRNVKTI